MDNLEARYKTYLEESEGELGHLCFLRNLMGKPYDAMAILQYLSLVANIAVKRIETRQ